MALIATQKGSVAGVAVTYAAATGGGDTLTNTGKETLHVKNGGVGSITVTIVAQHPCSFGVSNAAHDDVVTIGAGVDKRIGPFSKAQFSDDTDLVHVTYSGVTSVTVAVLG